MPERPVFQRLSRGDRIWALDRGVLALRTMSKLRADMDGQLGPGMLDSIEFERALDILFQMSVEIESGLRK